MAGFFKYPAQFAMVLAVALALGSAHFGFTELGLRGLAVSELGTVFLGLVFTALVIERAVEVYINNRYDPQEMDIQKGIRAAQQELTLLEEALAREIARSLPPAGDPAAAAASEEKREAVAALRDKVDAAREKVRSEKVAVLESQISLETRKAAAAAAMATALGALAASAGVRVFGQLVTVEEANAMAQVQYQSFWFATVDVILSAFLLAGGAEGIHNLVKDFLSRRNELRPTG